MSFTKDFHKEQTRYQKYARHLHPVGITHHMRPKSIDHMMHAIRFSRIQGAKVLEIGCGQGFLVNHFLYAGAKHVIGTDLEEQILETIPKKAYEVYKGQHKLVEFHVEDFHVLSQTDFKKQYGDVNIITMFIGIDSLIRKLCYLFGLYTHIGTIVFMIPTRGFSETRKVIEQYQKINNWRIEEFTLQLSGSGEQRRAMVIQQK